MRRRLDEAAKMLFIGDVVADSLRLVIPELAAALRLGAIEPLPTAYVDNERAKRFGDAAFRVDFRTGRYPASSLLRRGRRHYLLLAAEFQHRNDADMLARVRDYAAWQEQHYAQQGVVLPGEAPPLLPVVFHTGPDRWSAHDGLEVYRALPGSLAGLLAPFQRQAYIPVDVGPRSPLRPKDDTRLAAVMRLMASRTTRELAVRLAEERRRFSGPKNEPFRRGIHAWAAELALGNPDSGIALPSHEELERLEAGDTDMAFLFEGMFNEWADECRIEGREEGRVEGREQGHGEMLALIAERRFGADAAHQLALAANGSLSREKAIELGDLIARCDTADEFIERLNA